MVYTVYYTVGYLRCLDAHHTSYHIHILPLTCLYTPTFTTLRFSCLVLTATLHTFGHYLRISARGSHVPWFTVRWLRCCIPARFARRRCYGLALPVACTYTSLLYSLYAAYAAGPGTLCAWIIRFWFAAAAVLGYLVWLLFGSQFTVPVAGRAPRYGSWFTLWLRLRVPGSPYGYAVPHAHTLYPLPGCCTQP